MVTRAQGFGRWRRGLGISSLLAAGCGGVTAERGTSGDREDASTPVVTTLPPGSSHAMNAPGDAGAPVPAPSFPSAPMYESHSNGAVVAEDPSPARPSPPDCLGPRATTHVFIGMQLQSDTFIPDEWDMQHYWTCWNFETDVTVFTASGDSRRLELYFRHASDAMYEYHLLLDGPHYAPRDGGSPLEIGSGRLAFAPDGALAAEFVDTRAALPQPGRPDDQFLDLDFGKSIAEGGDGRDGTVSSPAFSAAFSQEIDGRGMPAGDAGCH
ncbi:MAG TPA: hypothetical protein VHE30_16650 [Polyangiaceae bacterium]|nr:hypothetical protein [Polyangiaceae bacterium]